MIKCILSKCMGSKTWILNHHFISKCGMILSSTKSIIQNLPFHLCFSRNSCCSSGLMTRGTMNTIKQWRVTYPFALTKGRTDVKECHIVHYLEEICTRNEYLGNCKKFNNHGSSLFSCSIKLQIRLYGHNGNLV